MTTFLPPLANAAAPAAASLRVRGSVAVAAIVGSNVAGATATMAVGNAVNGNGKATAIVAVTKATNGKAIDMNATQTTQTPAASILAADASDTPQFRASETAAFQVVDMAANVAANGAPISFIASLCVAEMIAPGLLTPRGKAPHRVARMKHAKEVFGNDRTPFRYWALATAYQGAFPDDARLALHASLVDEKGEKVTSDLVYCQRATERLVASMANRGFATMKALQDKYAPVAKKAPADADKAPSEGTSAAEGTAPAPAETAPALSVDQRFDYAKAMLSPGGFTPDQYRALSALILSIRPADMDDTQEAAPVESIAA